MARRLCQIIALLMWIWIKFYPCPHRPDARRLCQNYSAIHEDMDKIGLIHIHTDEVRTVCVKIIALPIWIWIKFYPYPHRREARRSCQNSQNGGCANTSSGTRLEDFICFYFRIFRTRRLSYENVMRSFSTLAYIFYFIFVQSIESIFVLSTKKKKKKKKNVMRKHTNLKLVRTN